MSSHARVSVSAFFVIGSHCFVVLLRWLMWYGNLLCVSVCLHGCMYSLGIFFPVEAKVFIALITIELEFALQNQNAILMARIRMKFFFLVQFWLSVF